MKRIISIKIFVLVISLLVFFGSPPNSMAQIQRLYGKVSWAKEKKFLDGIVDCLRDDKEKMGIISYIFAQDVSRVQAKAHVRLATNYLIKNRKIPYNQIRVVFSSYGRQQIEATCSTVYDLSR